MNEWPRPDYARIAQLERELGIGQPEREERPTLDCRAIAHTTTQPAQPKAAPQG